ncbi:MAG TPA: hypothetical protein VL147_02865, partial [Devosia sp.]|nr:hypothetical protein [Devosia sp.]
DPFSQDEQAFAQSKETLMMQLKCGVAAGAIALFVGLAGTPVALAQDAGTSYTATLTPLNAAVTGSQAQAEASFTVVGDQLTIKISATGVPPSIEHLQHFHGFAEGDQKSTCPVAASDSNGDGVIDIRETEATAGTTMVPFQDDPVGMEIVVDTYPTADAAGSYSYEKTVPLQALQTAFAGKFGGQQLDLDRRVVFIHGVPATTALAESVASLGDIPAQVTIPIACGEIQKVAN